MGNNRRFLNRKINEERNNYGNKGPWWYFTLHGLGPGMIPKDVHVVDSVEGVNKKGTRGLFIALDGVLTYDELKQYDLIELAPPKAMRDYRESLNEASGVKYLFTFKDNTEIAAHDEDEAIKKYERLWAGRDRKGARPFDELDKIAYDLYTNRDDEGFYDFNDEELAQLWARGSTVAYDDEVYETIRCLPHFKDIFNRADEISKTLNTNECVSEGFDMTSDMEKYLKDLKADGVHLNKYIAASKLARQFPQATDTEISKVVKKCGIK